MIKKTFHFEAAHMLSDYNGPCSNLHGHSYTGTVMIEAKVNPDTHMEMDFNTIKQVIDLLDHSIIFSGKEIRGVAETALYKWAITYGMEHYDMPDTKKCTAEDMAMEILHNIKARLPHDASVRVLLRETSTSEVDTGWIA